MKKITFLDRQYYMECNIWWYYILASRLEFNNNIKNLTKRKNAHRDDELKERRKLRCINTNTDFEVWAFQSNATNDCVVFLVALSLIFYFLFLFFFFGLACNVIFVVGFLFWLCRAQEMLFLQFSFNFIFPHTILSVLVLNMHSNNCLYI